ncbi:MAG: hypothetical protein WB987_05400 [Candidatus Acidiferrales bacterium]
MGSNYYPWGPHGERVSPFEVTPNPTPSTPAPQFDSLSFPQPAAPASNAYGGAYSGGYAGSRGYSGGHTGSGAAAGVERVGGFLVSLVVVGFLWQFFVCLYPLPALAAGFTTLFGTGLLARFFTADPVLRTITFLAALIGCGGGVVVLVVASRVEQRLARHAWYRIPRHLVRLALFALMAIFAIERADGIPLFAAEFSISGANLGRILRTPDYLIAVFVFVVVMHFVLWKAETIRAFWHRRMEALGLMKA